MRYWYSVFLLIVSSHIGLAQHQPRINQLYLNPFTYNPAYLGDEGYIEASLSHRRQWMGVDGAPATSWFTLQVPTDHRIALGLNIVDDRYGPIATTSALATFGYSVPFSQESYLRFGISGGVGTRGTDLSKFDDPDDPLISTATERRTYLDGSFGMHYRYANFNAGIALPRLFSHSLVSAEHGLETRLGQFDRFIAQAGYKFEFPLSHWSLHPQALYHVSGQVRQAEGLLVASYKDLVWGGAAYRQSNTWSGSVGFKLYQRAKIGYAYELASPQLAFGATHELTLHWQFGRKRKINKPGDIQQKQIERKIKTHLAQKPKPKLKPEKPEPESATAPSEPAVAEKSASERVERVSASENPNDLPAGYYVVAGTFGSEVNAQKWQQKLAQQGYDAQYNYSSARKFYYVYVAKFDALPNALQKARQLQKNSSLKDAWVLVIE